MNKIILIIIIVAVVIIIAGLWYFKFGGVSLKADIGGLIAPVLDLPFKSNLPELNLETFNLAPNIPNQAFPDIKINTD